MKNINLYKCLKCNNDEIVYGHVQLHICSECEHQFINGSWAKVDELTSDKEKENNPSLKLNDDSNKDSDQIINKEKSNKDELLKNEKTDIKKVKLLVDQKNKIIDGESKHKRHSVPKKVQDRVWNRDGGKCVECRSNENLEFDHIIPVSKGGANTYRNIQLLCGTCNRSKSDKIG
jgi:hypothetical protein